MELLNTKRINIILVLYIFVGRETRKVKYN